MVNYSCLSPLMRKAPSAERAPNVCVVKIGVERREEFLKALNTQKSSRRFARESFLCWLLLAYWDEEIHPLHQM